MLHKNKIDLIGMNIFLILLLLVGFVFIVLGYVKTQRQCPPAKVEYRFVPKTMVEDQESPVPISDIFAKMFYESTPWVSHSWRPLPPPNIAQKDIGKFFISQA